MKTLVGWLQRLQQARGEALTISMFGISVPGFEPLSLSNWLINCEPRPVAKHPVSGSSPTSHSILRILDLPAFTNNVNERHRLGAELAAALSLALGRRVEIGHEILIHVPQVGRVIRMPFTNMVDHVVLGPPALGLDAPAHCRRCGEPVLRYAALAPRLPHNERLLLAGAHVSKELAVVRLPAHALRASGRLAQARVARSRSAEPLGGHVTGAARSRRAL